MTLSFSAGWIIAISAGVIAVCAVILTLKASRAISALESFIKRSEAELSSLISRAQSALGGVDKAALEARDLAEEARRRVKRLDGVLDTAENVALNVRLTTLLLQKSLAPSLVTLSSVAAGVRKGLQVAARLRGR